MILLAIGAGAAAIPLLRWQAIEVARTSCQSNQRKLSVAVLLYSQDFDGALPQPERRGAPGGWVNWVQAIEPYLDADEVAVCPANPATGAKSASTGALFPFSYALNERFFDVFGGGPFPIDNLEIPARTVLLVEAGRRRVGGPFSGPALPIAASGYSDTAVAPDAYPSPHDGRMNVAAADAHSVSIKVAHYRPEGHDRLFGRLGGSVYNWNGGHPNGRTSEPPLE